MWTGKGLAPGGDRAGAGGVWEALEQRAHPGQASTLLGLDLLPFPTES